MHVMLDLETMGTRHNAPIVSIGAVRFDATGLYDEFYCNVSLDDAVKINGAIVDPQTVMWWMQQDKGAQEALIKTDAKSVMDALGDFAGWLGAVDGMWGNGAGFDNLILSEHYARAGLRTPWPFWADRCYRTIKGIYQDVPLKSREGTHHNALDDAKTQALHLIDICNKKDIKL